ncbi:60S ribosomal protein L3 [Mycena indigotica]|uniref:Large ribosomal subunit protein mL44 n=1 Tax=Mycena indigotica TaxID=2126181 RepID=A0A8H6WCF4_9AGAR|nr:60S ribosomal protein L3 [Mycena indigotica]KAF7309693.1 60S ribosomal protein L3 [Mycena indigotica]
MVYGQRRVVANALKNVTAVSVAHLPKFPPPASTQSLKVSNFDAETWGALQPPPPTALSAFIHRIGLGSVITNTDTILQACTHPSAQHLARRLDPNSPPLPTNAQLSTLGNALMGLFATEYVHAAYPHLPTRVMKAAVTAHVGPLTCSNVAQEMGAVPLLRWHREQPQTGNYQPPLQRSDALASIPRSLVALVYQHRSLPSARQFVHSYFLSREVDIRSMIKFVDPKKALKEMVAKFQREPPRSRLLKETGRFSNSPVFVVGIYSGEDKLGEGFGASLRMAEYRAAEDALLSVYLTRTPPELIQLPTSTFPLGLGDVFRDGPEGSYNAPQLEEGEVMYGSGGRSGVRQRI